MIGQKLKKYRQTLQVTGETLANLAGIKRSYLSQIENEKKIPPSDTFMNLIVAMCEIAPFNKENSLEILTDKNYQKFRSDVNIKIEDIPNDPNFDRPPIVIIFIEVKDSNVNFNFLSRKINNSLDINLYDKNIDKFLKNVFFHGHEVEIKHFEPHDAFYLVPNTDCLRNLEDRFIYSLPYCRKSIFNWWYNKILSDFYNSFSSTRIIESETTISMFISSLINDDGTFTPSNDKHVLNITKELINGKNVRFDLASTYLKEVTLYLDGELLTNKELETLRVSLNAIKYERYLSKIEF